MKKRQVKRLKLVSETVLRLNPAEMKTAQGGFVQCEDNSSGSFSTRPIGYCNTESGHSACP